MAASEGKGHEFIDELATHAAGGRDGGSMGLQETTSSSSGHFGCYTGRHIMPSPAVQVVTTLMPTGGGEKSRTSIDLVNTDDLGLECRCTVEREIICFQALTS